MNTTVKAFLIALIRYNLRECIGDQGFRQLEKTWGTHTIIEKIFDRGVELFNDRVFLHGAHLLEEEHKISSWFIPKDLDEKISNQARGVVLFVAYAANLLCREEGCSLNIEPLQERIWAEIEELHGMVKSHNDLRCTFDDLGKGHLSLCFSLGVFGFMGEDQVEITSYDVKENLNVQYLSQGVDLEKLCDYLIADAVDLEGVLGGTGAMIVDPEVWESNDKADLLPEILNPKKPLPEGVQILNYARFFEAIVYWLEEESGLMDAANEFVECGQFKTMGYYQISYYSWLVDQGEPIDPKDHFDIREHFYHHPDGCPTDIAENITMDQEEFEKYLNEHCTLKYVP